MTLDVNGRPFEVMRLLGKGKGGYSYLVTEGEKQFVLKQIHHEPCDYYTFGDKLLSELTDYERLRALSLPLPELLDVDHRQERLLKAYIDGPTAAELTQQGMLPPEALRQLEAMCRVLYPAGLNIDYYPTNFIWQGEQLWYIDYECNAYDEKWDFEHWGKQYWT